MRIQPLRMLIMLALVSLLLAACGGTSPAGIPVGTGSPPPGDQQTVTLANDGQTVALRVGERFLLKLGNDYEWAATVDNQSVVSRVVGITVILGAQGVYEAHQVGQTTLTAVGDPVCRQTNPPCAQPSRMFQVQLAVH